MARDQLKTYPDLVGATINGSSAYTPAGTLSTGIPLIAAPVLTNGKIFVPPGTGGLSGFNNQNYIRGYIQFWNGTIQREFKGGITIQSGYVGSHAAKMVSNANINYGLLGGGTASQPLFARGITSAVNVHQPILSSTYNSMQNTIKKRLANGLMVQTAYTWSHEIGRNTSILIPQYANYDKYTQATDRTHNLNISAMYELPFGKEKQYFKSGIAAQVLWGWATNTLYPSDQPL